MDKTCDNCFWASEWSDPPQAWRASRSLDPDTGNSPVLCTRSDPKTPRSSADTCGLHRHSSVPRAVLELAFKMALPRLYLHRQTSHLKKALDIQAQTSDTLHAALASFARSYRCVWDVWYSRRARSPFPEGSPQHPGWLAAINHNAAAAGIVLGHFEREPDACVRHLLRPFDHPRPDKPDLPDDYVEGAPEKVPQGDEYTPNPRRITESDEP